MDYVKLDFDADVKMEISVGKDILKRYLEIGKDFTTYDTNFFFANDVVNTIERTGDTEEKAISKVRKSNIKNQKIYEYAQKSGYEDSEKEVEKRIKNTGGV